MSGSEENDGPSQSRLDRLLNPKRKMDEVGLKASIPAKIIEIEEKTCKQSSLNDMITKLNSSVDKLFGIYMAAKMNDSAQILLTLRHLTGKALDEKFHKDTCANFRVGNFFDEAEAIVEVEMINRNRIYTDNAVIYGTVQHLLHCFKTKEKDLEEEKMKAGIHLQPSKIRRFWRDFLKRTFLDLYKAEEDESAEDSNPVLIFPNLDAFTNLEVFTQAASHLGKLLSSLLFHGRTYLIYIPADQLERTINLFSSDDIASQIYDIIYETKKSRTKYENRKKAGKIVSKKNRVALLTADLPSSDLPSLPVVDLLAYANEHHQEDTSESFSAMDEVENMSLNMMMNYSNNQQSSVPSMPPVPLERNWPSIPIFDEAQQQSSSQTLDLACKELMKNFEWKDFNKENNNTSGKASKKVVKSNNKNKTLESSSSRTNDGEAAKRTRISDRDRKRTSIYSPGKNEMDPTVARWSEKITTNNTSA